MVPRIVSEGTQETAADNHMAVGKNSHFNAGL